MNLTDLAKEAHEARKRVWEAEGELRYRKEEYYEIEKKVNELATKRVNEELDEAFEARVVIYPKTRKKK